MAVYTVISKKDLVQHLTRYGIGALVSFEGITEGVENTNYRVTTDQGVFILTLFEKRTRAEDLPFFSGFMEYLRARGIPCARILSGKNGEKLITLNGKPSLVTNFLEGRWPREIEDFHIVAVSRALAQMHLAGEKFKMRRDNAMSLPAWRDLVAACGDKAELKSPGLFHFLQQELAYLEENWPQGLPSGAIHADLFPDNVFFKDGKMTGIIDFYFSCTDVLVYDLMLAINAWCFSPDGTPYQKRTSLFLSTYKKGRSLNTQERTTLTFFGRAAAFRIALTRLYDSLHPQPGAVVKAKDPLEYMRILDFYQKEGFSV